MFSRSAKYAALCLLEIVIIVVLIAVFIKEVTPGAPLVARPELVSRPVVAASPTSTLLFVGDIMFDRYIRKVINEAQDPLLPFALIKPALDEADLVVGNLEGPITNRGIKQGSEYSFRFEPAGSINALKYAGFDVLNLANNHIWDYGRDAALDTMQYLRDAGVSFIGFGHDFNEANSPVIKNIGGTKIAFLGATEFYGKALWADRRLGLAEFDPDRIAARVTEIKKTKRADIVVVSFHWGVEYETHASKEQQKIAHQMIDAGADLVVGHHPHVVQEVEQYKSGWIAYSLGNFVFDQNFSNETMHGIMAQATIERGNVIDFKQIPISFSRKFQPYTSN